MIHVIHSLVKREALRLPDRRCAPLLRTGDDSSSEARRAEAGAAVARRHVQNVERKPNDPLQGIYREATMRRAERHATPGPIDQSIKGATTTDPPPHFETVRKLRSSLFRIQPDAKLIHRVEVAVWRRKKHLVKFRGACQKLAAFVATPGVWPRELSPSGTAVGGGDEPALVSIPFRKKRSPQSSWKRHQF